jgi:hypothetical protein
MQHGDIGPIAVGLTTVFVFDGTIATLPPTKVKAEERLLRKEKWGRALNLWSIDQDVCAGMRDLILRQRVPVEVLTWHSSEFAEIVKEVLYGFGVPVYDITSSVYEVISPQIAVNRAISTVYDNGHQFGYGYKGRKIA